ncbi:hypothetical protein [Nitrosopumilus sp.]|uniref:hypothetical protein n=1 Tax=Nitrosopumilus sp. TaxID=2024843 RepID=UPI00247B8F24|nr:hypothetical protein [Nitrosopumilus sp.]MCV0431426.1 hypothetical protein [Nitrosopumilus sp.]
MPHQKIPEYLQDKIFEIRYNADNSISKTVSYFPFSESEKQEIISLLIDSRFNGFHSIFTDSVTDEEWLKTKDQIKKKFRDELFDIDKI